MSTVNSCGDWPPYHDQTVYPYPGYAPLTTPHVIQYVPYTFTPYTAPEQPRLSDEDVDRIAKRVAELLKEAA